MQTPVWRIHVFRAGRLFQGRQLYLQLAGMVGLYAFLAAGGEEGFQPFVIERLERDPV
jgi:hypothetical protein